MPQLPSRPRNSLRRGPAAEIAPAPSASALPARGSDAAEAASPSSTKAPDAAVAIAVLPFADLSPSSRDRDLLKVRLRAE